MPCLEIWCKKDQVGVLYVIGLGSAWIHFGYYKTKCHKISKQQKCIVQRPGTYFMRLVRIASKYTFGMFIWQKCWKELTFYITPCIRSLIMFKESHHIITIQNFKNPHSYCHIVYYYPKYKLWRDRDIWTVLKFEHIFL